VSCHSSQLSRHADRSCGCERCCVCVSRFGLYAQNDSPTLTTLTRSRATSLLSSATSSSLLSPCFRCVLPRYCSIASSLTAQFFFFFFFFSSDNKTTSRVKALYPPASEKVEVVALQKGKGLGARQSNGQPRKLARGEGRVESMGTNRPRRDGRPKRDGQWTS
jgi:hypothetical protein